MNRSTHPTPRRHSRTPCPSGDLDQVRSLLMNLNPDMGYDGWMRVLMAIYFESGGNEEGFDLANAWSSVGSKYKGEKEIRTKWRSFAKPTGRPITIGTLKYMVKHQQR